MIEVLAPLAILGLAGLALLFATLVGLLLLTGIKEMWKEFRRG